MTETPLEMARRHVREGRERIAHQERLIAELEKDGHFALVPEATRFLETLQQFQGQFEAHVAELERAALLTDRPRP